MGKHIFTSPLYIEMQMLPVQLPLLYHLFLSLLLLDTHQWEITVTSSLAGICLHALSSSQEPWMS